jgi:hypothetical protein
MCIGPNHKLFNIYIYIYMYIMLFFTCFMAVALPAPEQLRASLYDCSRNCFRVQEEAVLFVQQQQHCSCSTEYVPPVREQHFLLVAADVLLVQYNIYRIAQEPNILRTNIVCTNKAFYCTRKRFAYWVTHT